MRFNNNRSDEPFPDTATLKKHPHQSTDQAHSALRIAGGPPSRSVIDACLTITGNLESERNVQVDGALHGDIRCAQLIVGRDATINGSIVADEVVVRGKVKGVIRAAQVMLQDTAQVESEIFHKSLVIEQGASFDGESRRIDEPAKAPADLKPESESAAA
jgi:cytoskeletal protein CcmA (bactofilin family)